MNTVDAVEILDKAVDAKNLYEQVAGNFNSPIILCQDESIQVYSGIEELAKAAGAKIKLEKMNFKVYPLQKTFVYRNRKFIQLVASNENNK